MLSLFYLLCSVLVPEGLFSLAPNDPLPLRLKLHIAGTYTEKYEE